MLSFKSLSEKKTKVKINPKKEDITEGSGDDIDLKKNHGDDCDCIKCEKKRRSEDIDEEKNPYSMKNKLKMVGSSIKDRVKQKARALTTTHTESASLKKAKINFNTSKKGGKTIYKVNKNDEADAQKAMKNDPKYISGKTRVQAHQEAYGGKGVSRKTKLASLHPPTAQAAVKNIPTETDRGAGNKAMRRAGKTVEKKSPTYKAYVANKMNEATRYSKETGKSFKTGRPVVKGGTAKDDKAFQAVAKKYSGQMMGGQQKKKVRGQKHDDSNTPFKRAAARIKQVKADNKAFTSRAKKAGFKSTQDYANTVARYGGEKDYQNPNKRGGLGS